MASRTLIALVALALTIAGCSTGDAAGERRTDDAVARDAAEAAAPVGGSVSARDGVTVTGQGRASARPDVLRAIVGAEVVETSIEAALDRANERAAAVVAALEDAGIPSEDIQTSELSVRERHPERHAEPRPQPAEPAEIAYVATNLVEVVIRDIDAAGAVLQAAVDAGGEAARIRHVRFALEDQDEVVAEAREQAFADARATAEQYAALAERQLGELQAIRETRTGPGPPGPVAEDVARGGAIPLEPGTDEVVVQLTAVWALR